ncbi:MAG: F420-dependent methylene-tetrahydromethanopterin reductase, partial [Mycobacteriaceae bacterium]
LTPAGLDEFVDTVVPELQERGTFRTEYAGATLREHLDVPWPEQAATGTTREAVAS